MRKIECFALDIPVSVTEAVLHHNCFTTPNHKHIAIIGKTMYNIKIGADFKLDIGPLQISSRIACQRYRQNPTDAEKTTSRVAMIKELAGNAKLAFSFNTPAYAQA